MKFLLGIDVKLSGNACIPVLSMCIVNEELEEITFLLRNGVYFDMSDPETRFPLNLLNSKKSIMYIFQLIAENRSRRDQIDKMLVWS